VSIRRGRSWPFSRRLVIDNILLQQLGWLVVAMSGVNSFIIGPDMLLYAVTLLSQMSEGKRCMVL